MASNQVYTGFWINWNGKCKYTEFTNQPVNNITAASQVAGLTLTTAPSNGPYLIAFVAFFSGIAGSNLWTIICFFIHQKRSTASDRSALHHQLQVLLRNAPQSPRFLWMVWELCRTRKGKTSLLNSTTYLAIAAVTHIAVTAAISVFSSKITLSGNEVLVHSISCGWTGMLDDAYFALTGTNSEDWVSGTYMIGRWTATQALQYAQTCYNSTGSTSSDSCRLYSMLALSLLNYSAPCPFDQNFCSQELGISVDSGYINSNKHLGINASPEDNMRFRKVLTCVPTAAEERYSSDWEPSEHTNPLITPWNTVNVENKFKSYHLGTINTFGFTSNVTFGLTNYSLWEGQPGYNLQYVSSV
jgi:hypothetical protein